MALASEQTMHKFLKFFLLGSLILGCYEKRVIGTASKYTMSIAIIVLLIVYCGNNYMQVY